MSSLHDPETQDLWESLLQEISEITNAGSMATPGKNISNCGHSLSLRQALKSSPGFLAIPCCSCGDSNRCSVWAYVVSVMD